MKITKAQLFSTIADKSASITNNCCYCVNHVEENEKIISNTASIVSQWNSTNDSKITAVVKKDISLIELSSGEVVKLRKPPMIGFISLHADHINVAGIIINKSDIIVESLTDDSFKTRSNTTIKFW